MVKVVENGGCDTEIQQAISRTWLVPDNWRLNHPNMVNSGKYPLVEIQDANIDGLKIGRDKAQILHELGLKGYSPAEIQELISPTVRKRTEQELLAENQKVKAEMEQLER